MSEQVAGVRLLGLDQGRGEDATILSYSRLGFGRLRYSL